MFELNLTNLTGLDSHLLLILITFPIVATVAGLARHIIGIKSLSVYAPIILTYSFFALSFISNSVVANPWEGLGYGLFFVGVVVAAALVASQILKYSRMHYFPKISLVLSFGMLALMLSLILISKISHSNLKDINILALVLLASIAEQFTATMFKKQTKAALLLTLESLFTSIIAFYLISWTAFQDLIMHYPYLVLLSFLINYLVGKYRGLRVLEFIRFKDVLKIAQPDNTQK